MNKIGIVVTFLCFGATLWMSCGENETDNGNGQLDVSVIGYWEGSMGPLKPIDFKGVEIFNRITAVDSTFTLVTLDTSQGTAPPIRDTTLYLAGKWRLNIPGDSILLLPDTCRIIDTAQNILVPREVRGQIIPLWKNIAKNNVTGQVEWRVYGTDLAPLAPLIGINLSGFSALLQIIEIILTKQ